MTNDTIAAISTPSGEGGIGVIRISGGNAIEIADKIFNSVSGKKLTSLSGYSALYGKVLSGGKTVDEAVALVFRAPKSYTGENVAEISVHGGNYVVKETLRAAIAAGARAADGGEFTRRAYQNGKLDLLEAEAVMGIISANGEKAQRAALSLHEGVASKKIAEIKSSLLNTAAGLAVFSDYPDDELPEFNTDTLLNSLTNAENELGILLSTYDAGKILREGVNTVIAGRPNVGKSTLMNLLSGCRRSIVTAVPGTTRDVVEEKVLLGDIVLRLSDTAGLRDTADEVEKIGVEISHEKIESAGLILAVFDGSKPATKEDAQLIDICKRIPSVAVINKSDLENKFDMSLVKDVESVVISAGTGNGTDELYGKIAKVCGTYALDGNETVLCSERQRSCVQNALGFVKEARLALTGGVTLDAVGVCIDDAMQELLSLTGERVTNAVVDEIFSKFCVGK